MVADWTGIPVGRMVKNEIEQVLKLADILERRVIGQMLADWQKRHPGRIESILRALTEVRPSHLLDKKLYDFSDLP